MRDCLRQKPGAEMERQGEQGFMLVGLIVAIFIILLALSVAAPKVAQGLRREREVEAIHRGDQYVRAIRVFYRKNGNFPGSMEQLEKTNNVRYLRQQYLDPMTGKADWRLIHIGEAKTTVKGFFGQALSGMAPGLGSAAGAASNTPGGIGGSAPSGFGSSGTSGYGSSGTSGFGSSGTSGFGSSSGSSGMPTLGGSSPTSGTAAPGSSSSGSGTTNTLGSASGIASDQSGSGMPKSGGPFIGIGVPKEGDSITILNEQTTYNTWEFIYDPRIEQLYAKGALLGGGATGLGSAAGNSSGFGSGTAPTSGPGTGYGTSPSTGFGTSPSSGFGTSPGSGFGSSPTTPAPTTPTPPQQ